MFDIDKNYILILVGFGAVLLEIIMGAATGFDLFLVGIALILGGLSGLVFHNFILSLIVIVILLIVYFFIGRKYVKKTITIKTTKTNTDNLFGKMGIVTKTIIPDKPGQIKVEGEIWRAESDKEILVGETVKIESVSGVTLKVSSKV